jgi:acyl carrier protein
MPETGHEKGVSMQAETAETVRQLLVQELFVEVPADKIALDDGLQSEVGLDSVAFIELRVLCEERFDIEIADEDFRPENFSSVRRIAELIQRLQNEKHGAAGYAQS